MYGVQIPIQEAKEEEQDKAPVNITSIMILYKGITMPSLMISNQVEVDSGTKAYIRFNNGDELGVEGQAGTVEKVAIITAVTIILAIVIKKLIK